MAIAVLLAATARCGYPDFQFTSGGAGGGAGACRVLDGAADCGATERCTIVDESTGATGCVALAASPLHPYEACASDTACPTGTWCDGRTGVCMPFCQTAQDCHGNDCVAARNTSDSAIPGGTSVCVANCDPVAGTPCGNGTTCTYDAQVGDMDCFASLGMGDGEPCAALNDCGMSLVCVGGTCDPWCHPAGSEVSADCEGGECDMFSNLAPMYDGSTYGFCD
jgi:hypothetical protein